MSGIVCSKIASDKERETYPIVYFEDLALDIPVKGRWGKGQLATPRSLQASGLKS